MPNPHYEILSAVKAQLEASPAIANLGTVVVRELPYVRAAADPMPLCVVCPPDGQGEKLVKNVSRLSSGTGGVGFWGYPALVLLISVSNRALSSGLEARLQTRHDVSERLFSTTLDGDVQVFDCDPDPKAVAPLQAALGANYVVSGFLMTYRRARTRGA